MVSRRSKKAVKRAQDLPAKTLTSKKARGVKGGVIAIIAPAGASALLLPAVQKVRES